MDSNHDSGLQRPASCQLDDPGILLLKEISGDFLLCAVVEKPKMIIVTEKRSL